MEAVYGGAGVVNALNGGVLCYGTGDMDRPVALVQVDIAALKKWADGAGVAYKSAEALCESKEAEKYVLDELNKVGKSGKLGANEVLAGVSLIGTGEPTRGRRRAAVPRPVDAAERRAHGDEQDQPQADREVLREAGEGARGRGSLRRATSGARGSKRRGTQFIGPCAGRNERELK